MEYFIKLFLNQNKEDLIKFMNNNNISTEIDLITFVNNPDNFYTILNSI